MSSLLGNDDKPMEWTLGHNSHSDWPDILILDGPSINPDIDEVKVIEYTAYERSQAELAEARQEIIFARAEFQSERELAWQAKLTALTEQAGRLVGAAKAIFDSGTVEIDFRQFHKLGEALAEWEAGE